MDLWNQRLWEILPSSRPRLLFDCQVERVVYIPDCREFMEDSSVENLLAAMLFAWADDPTILDEIITLDSMEKMPRFFRNYKGKVIFIFDQMNAFAELDEDGEQARDLKGKMSAWLLSCRAGCKAIFSNPANYRAFLYQLQKEN